MHKSFSTYLTKKKKDDADERAIYIYIHVDQFHLNVKFLIASFDHAYKSSTEF